MAKCENCGAEVEKLGLCSDGRMICCPHCVFNPLGCRCKYGEYGVAEEYDYACPCCQEWNDD